MSVDIFKRVQRTRTFQKQSTLPFEVEIIHFYTPIYNQGYPYSTLSEFYKKILSSLYEKNLFLFRPTFPS